MWLPIQNLKERKNTDHVHTSKNKLIFFSIRSKNSAVLNVLLSWYYNVANGKLLRRCLQSTIYSFDSQSIETQSTLILTETISTTDHHFNWLQLKSYDMTFIDLFS